MICNQDSLDAKFSSLPCLLVLHIELSPLLLSPFFQSEMILSIELMVDDFSELILSVELMVVDFVSCCYLQKSALQSG